MTIEKQVEQALVARLAALDGRHLDEVVSFYTNDGVVVARSENGPNGIFTGQEQLTRFYRELFIRLPHVHRTAENVIISASDSEAMVLYDIRVQLSDSESSGQFLGLVTVADLWKRVGSEWKLARHIGRLNR